MSSSTRPARARMRRRRGWVLVIAVLAGAVPAACATHTGSQAKFCAALPKTGDLLSVLNDLSSTDPKTLQTRFQAAADRYEQLEQDAPREIRGDVATVTSAVQEILDIVQRHPDDLSAIRTELNDNATDFVGAGKAASSVATYARTKCGLNLNPSTTLLDNPDAGVTTTTG